jgi:hypothetical protein
MPAFRSRIFGAVLALTAVLSTSQVASAAQLVTWELTGVNAPVASVLPTTMASGVVGTPITRSSGLSDVGGSLNSFNSSGWNTAGQFVDLGFTLARGTTAIVNEFIFASRSSATGPGTMNVVFSVDGGPPITETTLIQPDPTGRADNGFVNTDLTFAPITVHSSLDVRFQLPPGALAANGGTIGSAGTWRIGDFLNSAGAFLPVQINGTAIPEPSSFVLAGIGLAGAAVMSRVRRKQSACA